jgi:glycosyltransferase involved in cell wall biosynthesis
MKFSVVICTHNRGVLLADCLESIRRCRPPRDASPEIMVVDNASTNDMAEVVARLRPFPFELNLVREERLGLSQARNRGWQASRGEVIAFADDDVLVDEQYLAAAADAFRRDLQLEGAGGRILPRWEAPRPSWLDDGLLGVLAVCDYGDDPFPFTGPEQLPRGANLILRRRFLEDVGGFRTDLGRVGSSLQSCEDDAMVLGALERGLKIAYAPSILVEHRIGAERLVPGYFRRWKWQSGRSLARMKYPHRKPCGRVHPLRTIARAAITNAAQCLKALARGDVDAVLRQELELRTSIAVCWECWFGNPR